MWCPASSCWHWPSVGEAAHDAKIPRLLAVSQSIAWLTTLQWVWTCCEAEVARLKQVLVVSSDAPVYSTSPASSRSLQSQHLRALLPSLHNMIQSYDCWTCVMGLWSIAAGTGPTGRALDLRHAARGQPASIDELARLLLNVCQAVPQVGALQQQSCCCSLQPSSRAADPRERLWQAGTSTRGADEQQAFSSAFRLHCRVWWCSSPPSHTPSR